MKKIKYLTFILVATLLAGCAGTSAVITDHKRGISFNQYKTYYWANEFTKEAGNEHPLLYNSLIQTRLKNAIQNQMSNRGFTLSSDNPDLLVNAKVIAKSRDVSTIDYYPDYYYPFYYRDYYPYYGGRFYYPGFGRWFGYYYDFDGSAQVTTTKKITGSLVIQLIDQQNHQLIWQGYLNDALHTSTKDKSKELNNAVERIFAKFDKTTGQPTP
ncbi:MAG TPA: DUF4136 domain-containing protein [Balneolaceae bacterium]|nr:DUF4136 domain-containing protein [Balneolaceae bacterium]